jgi:hypothetical protein
MQPARFARARRGTLAGLTPGAAGRIMVQVG